MNVCGLLLPVLVGLLFQNSCCFDVKRSFTIETNGHQFLKDGQPFRYVSGTLHYFKVPSAFWYDRMYKYKMAGLNAVQTYIEWNFHEPEEGVFDFEGDQDLIQYLETANELGLLVILRTGPFIDAERDLGGLPYWLFTKNPSMKLRTSDPTYVKEVDKWFSLLLPMLRPMLYKNGGPIAMVQVENEYGSYYACDYNYVAHLRDLHHQYLGDDVLLFSTDGNDDYFLKCGKMDGVFATVDFGSGSDPVQSFHAQRVHQEFGPNVNSEYYTGWIDHWETPHSTAESKDVCHTLDLMLAMNASVNLYPLHGGTSFGFGAGANMDGDRYDPCITSYDFDAPLTESGDPTQKYYDVRKVIGKYLPLPNGTLPVPSPKMSSAPLVMKPVIDIYDIIDTQTPIYSLNPLAFETLRIKDGFVLYSTNITILPSDPAVLTINGLADRAQVFVNKRYIGTLSRTQSLYSIGLDIEKGSRLDLLVENQGRVCYGTQINELKGIQQNVTLGPFLLQNWNHYLLFKNWSQQIDYLETVESANSLPQTKGDRIPKFFSTQFVLDNKPDLPLDSFLRLDGWRKGMAFLNGFNLGRYWTVGPQITLYAPKHLFNAYPKTNKLTVLELEWSPLNQTVQFVTTSDLNATTPYSSKDEHNITDKAIKPSVKLHKFNKTDKNNELDNHI